MLPRARGSHHIPRLGGSEHLLRRLQETAQAKVQQLVKYVLKHYPPEDIIILAPRLT